MEDCEQHAFRPGRMVMVVTAMVVAAMVVAAVVVAAGVVAAGDVPVRDILVWDLPGLGIGHETPPTAERRRSGLPAGCTAATRARAWWAGTAGPACSALKIPSMINCRTWSFSNW